MNTEHHRVVCGVSSVDPRLPMVRWAAAEAAARGAELRLVTAVPNDAPADLYLRPNAADAASATAAAGLDRAARCAVEGRSGLLTSTLVVGGPPTRVLRDTASESDLLVIGADDQSPFAEAVIGSIPGALLTTSPCPLAVVPQGTLAIDDTAPVTVAVDEHGTSQAAIAYAFAAARRSGRRLELLRCDADNGARLEESLILTGFSGLYPEVEVTYRAEDDELTEMLVRSSRRSAQLVLGSRGRGRLASALFGSVSRTLIRRSGCPVVVARPRQVELNQGATA